MDQVSEYVPSYNKFSKSPRSKPVDLSGETRRVDADLNSDLNSDLNNDLIIVEDYNDTSKRLIPQLNSKSNMKRGSSSSISFDRKLPTNELRQDSDTNSIISESLN